MPSPDTPVIDIGLLSPVSAGHDAAVSDAAVLAALVETEIALTRAWVRVGTAPPAAAAAVSAVDASMIDAGSLAAAATAGANPIIPLVPILKEAVPMDARGWVHCGATSQDILDSALMLLSSRACEQILASLAQAEASLNALAQQHRTDPAAARTLTQHAVPIRIGARVAGWTRGIRRASLRLEEAKANLPAQLGGAGGTRASFVEIGGAEIAAALPAAFAGELGLADVGAVWQVNRWPVTELGDALVQAVDALGKVATDVATLSRTEIGEVAEGAPGGSSAMPQKQNPAAAVLIRSAAIRAPHLGATLHLASALAGDERPDGAWHAEWQTLRELLRLALGAAATAAGIAASLGINADAAADNLARTGGLIVAERLSIVLTPLVGADTVTRILADARAGGDLGTLIAEALEAAIDRVPGATHPADRVDALLDPAGYLGSEVTLADLGAPVVADQTPAEQWPWEPT